MLQWYTSEFVTCYYLREIETICKQILAYEKGAQMEETGVSPLISKTIPILSTGYWNNKDTYSAWGFP